MDRIKKLAIDLKREISFRKQSPDFGFEIASGEPAVFRVDLHSDAVSTGPQCGDHCRAGAAERVEDRIVGKREHAHEAIGQFEGERRGMLFG